MPSKQSDASALAPLLDGSSAGELIPELVRHGLQQLIELEVAAVLAADRHERSEERPGYRNGYRPRVLTTQVGDIDLQVQAFLSRPLEGQGYAYLYLDATYLHGRLGRAMQVCSRAVVVAMGVNADGRRELLGLRVGDSESEPFWSQFLGSL